MSLDLCRIVELPKISDPRGKLSFIDGGQHVPFDIRRLSFLIAEAIHAEVLNLPLGSNMAVEQAAEVAGAVKQSSRL